MKHPSRNYGSHATGRGFTLVELLVVIGILMVLMGGMIKVAQSVRTNAQIRNTQAAMQVLCAALEEYRDIRKGTNLASFPIDVYQMAIDDTHPDDAWDFLYLKQAIQEEYIALDLDDNFAVSDAPSPKWQDWQRLPGEQRDERLAARNSIKAMYFYLSQEEDCREILEKLPEELTTNFNNDAVNLDLDNDDIWDVSLIEVNDAWGRPLRYRCREGGNFPELVSAGKDGLFDNADDIRSSEF